MTSVAALSAIAGPVALVIATAGNPHGNLAAEQASLLAEVRDIRSQSASVPTPFSSGLATDANQLVSTDALAASIAATTTTTTLPPAPTTTTTAAPPPRAVARPVAVPAPPPPSPAPAPASAPAPAPAPAPARGGADPSDPATWDRLAACESGGNWAANTGNGYYGGLQFSASTWRSVGGSGLPHEHSRATQIEMGQRLQARAGWGQWPACTRKLGYR
ncbi:MAG: transglycosylase family protein [Acidimicrobiales bacterium]|nr:transglycosylase family protein [Acidimicrobiales bacterium]